MDSSSAQELGARSDTDGAYPFSPRAPYTTGTGPEAATGKVTMNFNRGSLSVYLYKPVQNPDRPPCSLIYRRYLHPAKAAYHVVLSIL